LFTELFSRLPGGSFEVVGFRESPTPGIAGPFYRFEPPRFLERYRGARVRQPCELFHSTYYRLPARRGPKVVTTVYDFIYERIGRLPARLIHSTQKRRAIAGSDRLICISESTRRDLIEFMGPSMADRAVVVPLAASREFTPIPGTASLPQVLFIGRRVASKNYTAVVAALSGMPDLQLLLVGGGPLTKAETESLDRQIPGRYRKTGHITNAALNVEYNRSLCLAYPSTQEGFGIPIVEAMQAGCPVIAVNRSSVPEVAGSAAFLLDRGEPDEIRHAIESLKVSATRDALVSKGRVQAQKFSWDATYAKTIAVYEQMTGKPFGR
jgi:mannosyltransferase